MRKTEGDPRRTTAKRDQQRGIPVTSPNCPAVDSQSRWLSPERQAYPSEELPRFLYPSDQAYDPTAVSSRAAVYNPSSPYFQGHGHHAATAASPSLRYSDLPTHYGARTAIPSPSVDQHYTPSIRRNSREASIPCANPYTSPLNSDSGRRSYDPRERAHEEVPHRSISPTSTASVTSYYSTTSPNHRHGSISGVPTGFEQILHPLPRRPLLASSPSRQATSAMSRFRLHIRQQPIAARACGAGDKDRRPIDPPPIVQMLLVDFDPASESDLETLRDPRFTVGCLLYSVTPSSTLIGSDGEAWEERVHRSQIIEPLRSNETAILGASPGGQPQSRSIQVLSGKLFVSPFFVDEDPDPSTAPAYPTSSATQETRYSTGPLPASFFIFADLSVRTAGLYRLKFRLMNWGSIEETGESMPILTETWSDTFRVHPAKDFPGMRESSRLTEQLKALGVGELKTRSKGKGKGHGK